MNHVHTWFNGFCSTCMEQREEPRTEINFPPQELPPDPFAEWQPNETEARLAISLIRSQGRTEHDAGKVLGKLSMAALSWAITELHHMGSPLYPPNSTALTLLQAVADVLACPAFQIPPPEQKEKQ